MLFFILILKGLIIACLVYAAGAAVALALWLLGLIIKVRIPAFIRWGAMGFILAHALFHSRPDLLAEPSISAAEGTNQACAGLGCAALLVTGIILSLAKLTVKVATKGVLLGASAISAAADKKSQSPPPLP